MVPCEVAKSSVGSFADTDPVSNSESSSSPVQHCVNPKRDTIDRFRNGKHPHAKVARVLMREMLKPLHDPVESPTPSPSVSWNVRG